MTVQERGASQAAVVAGMKTTRQPNDLPPAPLCCTFPAMGEPQRQDRLILPGEYLAGERMATQRHEFLNGVIYAMAGASTGHGRIAANLSRHLGNQLEGKPCEAFTSDLRVRIRLKNAEFYYYPDVLVDCSGNADTTLYADQPTVIFEIMSPETERVDRHEKLSYYQTIPSLQAYVLVDQFHLVMTVYRRSEEGWTSEILTAGDTLDLDCIQFRLPIQAAYDRTHLAQV